MKYNGQQINVKTQNRQVRKQENKFPGPFPHFFSSTEQIMLLTCSVPYVRKDINAHRKCSWHELAGLFRPIRSHSVMQTRTVVPKPAQKRHCSEWVLLRDVLTIIRREGRRKTVSSVISGTLMSVGGHNVDRTEKGFSGSSSCLFKFKCMFL